MNCTPDELIAAIGCGVQRWCIFPDEEAFGLGGGGGTGPKFETLCGLPTGGVAGHRRRALRARNFFRGRIGRVWKNALARWLETGCPVSGPGRRRLVMRQRYAPEVIARRHSRNLPGGPRHPLVNGFDLPANFHPRRRLGRLRQRRRGIIKRAQHRAVLSTDWVSGQYRAASPKTVRDHGRSLKSSGQRACGGLRARTRLRVSIALNRTKPRAAR